MHQNATVHAEQALTTAATNQTWRKPLWMSLPHKQPVAVALGKFDALHLGHQALAVNAAQLGGHPVMISFSGMADVLGWATRLPLVAECDRTYVLQSWARFCCGKQPLEHHMPFQEVSGMAEV